MAVMLPRLLGAVVGLVVAGVAVPVQAATVTFQNATATVSQAGFPVSETIDGSEDASSGWGIDPFYADQVAVWETQSDFDANLLSFQLVQNYDPPRHLIGNFRLSVTSDDRNTFADGLSFGGDVTANWSVLTNPTVSGPADLTFSTLADDSVLVGGATPLHATYLVEYSVAVSGITGVRLEVFQHASLPQNGPGLAHNGNFVLSEFTLDATTTIPLPAAFPLFATALAGMGLLGRRRKRKAAA